MIQFASGHTVLSESSGKLVKIADTLALPQIYWMRITVAEALKHGFKKEKHFLGESEALKSLVTDYAGT